MNVLLVSTLSAVAVTLNTLPGTSVSTARAGGFEDPVILSGSEGRAVRDIQFYGSYAVCRSAAGHFRPKFIGTLAYVCDWDEGLFVVDLADPTAPMIVDQVALPGSAREVAIHGSFAYVSTLFFSFGLTTLDASDLRHPVYLRTNPNGGGNGLDIVVEQNHAYVGDVTGL